MVGDFPEGATLAGFGALAVAGVQDRDVCRAETFAGFGGGDARVHATAKEDGGFGAIVLGRHGKHYYSAGERGFPVGQASGLRGSRVSGVTLPCAALTGWL